MSTIGNTLNSFNNKRKLKSINKILFTNREIDIIVCLLHGRSVKKTAVLLSISPKTVEVHLRNIMLKIECNSREKIIDFIELSSEHSKLMGDYKLILEKNHFNLALNKIKNFYIEKKETVEIIVHSNISRENNFLIKSIQEVISKINVQASIHLLGAHALNDTAYTVYIITNNIEREAVEKHLNNVKRNVLIVYLNTISHLEAKKPNIYKILVNYDSSFHFMVLEIMCYINSFKEVSAIKEFFLKQHGSIYSNNKIIPEIKEDIFLSHENNVTDLSTENCVQGSVAVNWKERVGKNDLPIQLIDCTEKNYISSLKIDSNKIIAIFIKWKKSFFIIAAIVSIILLGVCYVSLDKKPNRTQIDLLLPSEEIFIKRNLLLKKIEVAFNKNKNKIKSMIIVGMGGIGKTTIVRHYAINQNNNIFWEINAESDTEIIRSFERFAIALSKSKEQRKELDYIYTVQNIDLFKAKLIAFIQRSLYNNPHWLLIYDNVNNLNDIIQYLPRNENVWGIGKILILTRNQNITNNKYIDSKNIISVPELSLKEKEKLFLNIYSTSYKNLSMLLIEDNLENFLKQIPSYPLDIMSAAYFLKNTNMGYNEYIKHINDYSATFRSLDATILKDTDNILKTRYTIVANTIQNIIKYNNNFKNKLLSISLLSSNGIPLELLFDNDEQELLITFIKELSKYSLINYTNSTNNNISLHNSVHNIIYINLRDELHSINGIIQTRNLIKKVANQLSGAINQEHIYKIRSWIIQAEALMKKLQQYNYIELNELKYQIGRAYRYLGKFNEAIVILESINNFAKNIEVLIELGTIYKNTGQYSKSVLLIEKALSRAKKQYGSDSIQVARVEIRLDTPYRKLRKYKEAKVILEHSLKIHENSRNINLADIAWVCTKLGYLNVKLDSLNNAIDLFNKSLKIQDRLYGANNIRTAWTYVRMANAYKELKEYKIAGELVKKSFKIYENHYGKNHTKTAWVLSCLGEIEGLLGNFRKAQKCIQEALEIQKQYYGANSIRLVWSLNKLAELYAKEKMYSKSDHYFNLIKEIKKNKS